MTASVLESGGNHFEREKIHESSREAEGSRLGIPAAGDDPYFRDELLSDGTGVYHVAPDGLLRQYEMGVAHYL